MTEKTKSFRIIIYAWVRRIVLLGFTLTTLGVVILGVMSYFGPLPSDGLWITSPIEEAEWQSAAIKGRLYIVRVEPWDQGPIQTWDDEFLGFGYKQDAFDKVKARGLQAPFWAPAILLFFYPLLAFIRGPVRRRRRRRRGECVHCGYLLTNLPENRCPECGTEFDPRRQTRILEKTQK